MKMHATALTMTGGRRALVLRAMVPMVATDAAKSWIHVAYEGKWEGHADGPFELTQKSFAQMVANFNAQKNPIPVDYEHASVRTDGRNGVPAAGWIHALKIEGAGLFALVEWTQRAASMIKAGEYRFCSGVFVFGDKDRTTGKETGAEMFNCALTNTPFLDGQIPITLSRAMAATQMDAIQVVAQIAELLGLEKGADAATIAAALEGLAKLSDAQQGKAGDEAMPDAEAMAAKPPVDPKIPCADVPGAPPAAPPAPPPAVAQPMAADPASVSAGEDALGILRQCLGLADTADAASVLAALNANKDAIKAAVSGGQQGAPMAASRTVIAAYDATVRSLTDRIATYEKREAETREATIAARVDAMMSTGHPESLRATFLQLARTSPAEFETIASTLKPLVPLGEAAPSPKPANASAPAHDEVMEARVVHLMRVHNISRAEAEPRAAKVTQIMNRQRGAV